jgi:hypothetical protein
MAVVTAEVELSLGMGRIVPSFRIVLASEKSKRETLSRRLR